MDAREQLRQRRLRLQRQRQAGRLRKGSASSPSRKEADPQDESDHASLQPASGQDSGSKGVGPAVALARLAAERRRRFVEENRRKSDRGLTSEDDREEGKISSPRRRQRRSQMTQSSPSSSYEGKVSPARSTSRRYEEEAAASSNVDGSGSRIGIGFRHESISSEQKKSEAPSPSEAQAFGQKHSPEAKHDDAPFEGVKSSDKEDGEDEKRQVDEDFFTADDLDDLDASGVCDTPIADHSNQDRGTEGEVEAQESGSDTETEHRDLHGLASSPSSGFVSSEHVVKPAADLDRTEEKFNSRGDVEGGHLYDDKIGQRQKRGQEAKGRKGSRDALASIFEFLDDTEANQRELESESYAPSTSSSLLRAPVLVGGGIVSGTPVNNQPAADSAYDWETGSQISAAPSIAGSVSTQMSTLTGPIGTVYDGMKARLTGLTMEVEDKSRTLASLKRLLREARQAHRDAEEGHQKETAEKMAKVREEYEATIGRHLGFIDRLLADKQSLSDKCDALAEEMKRLERRHGVRAQEIQERHVAELKRQKEALAAGERARRERWTEEQRRQIKETTLKGLEPELQRILAKHKKQMRQLEDAHAAQLRDFQSDAQRDRDESLRRLRERLDAEREEAVAAEVDIARAKLREQAKKYDEDHARARERWERENNAIRGRGSDEMENLRKRHADEMEAVRDEGREARAAMQRVFEEEKRDLARRFDDRAAATAREQAEARAKWQDELEAKLRAEAASEAEKLKMRLVTERDNQIDLVIRRLDEESGAATRAAAADFARRETEMASEHEKSLRQIRASESAWMDKFTNLSEEHKRTVRALELAKAKQDAALQSAAEMEAKVAEMRAAMHRQEADIRKQNAEARAQDVKEAERQRRRISELERQVEEEQDENAMAVAEERRRRSAELDQVHSRVRQTIARKDEVIATLNDRLRTAQLQAQKAAELLETQREELLG